MTGWRFGILAALAAMWAAASPASALSFAVPAPGGAPATLDGPPAPTLDGRDFVADIEKLGAAFRSYAPETDSAEALAATFGGDPRAAFVWVRDNIRLDAYAGHLRDPDGVLAARSGNAEDRARLLQRLLEIMAVPARIVQTADISAEARGKLTAALFAPRGGGQPAEAAFAPDFIARVNARALRDYGLLTSALGEVRVAEMAAAPAAAMAFAAHVWVQAEIDGVWTDLDTSLTDAEPGQPLAAATPAKADAANGQTVTLTLKAKTSTGEAVLLAHDMAAADAANADIFLLFRPGAEGLAALHSADKVVPILLIGSEAVSGTAIAAGSAAGPVGPLDLTGEGASGEPAISELSLRIETNAPGEPVETAVRILAQAAPGGSLSEDKNGVLAWRWLHHIVISTGASSPRSYLAAKTNATILAARLLAAPDALADQPLAVLAWPMAVADRALTLFSERVTIEALNNQGTRAFVARPRVTIVSIGPDDNGKRHAVIDLALDGVRVIAEDGGATANARLWYGVVQSALETEFGRLRYGAMDEDRRTETGGSVNLGDAPLSVFDGPKALPPKAPAAMIAQAATARIIVAGDPAAANVWWTIAPDGLSRSVGDPSLGMFNGGGNYVKVARIGATNYVNPVQNGTAQQAIADWEAQAKAVKNAKPPEGCKGAANEETIMLGCVSIPTSVSAGVSIGVIAGETLVIVLLTYIFG